MNRFLGAALLASSAIVMGGMAQAADGLPLGGAAPAAPTGMITSLNATEIKAMFDHANIKAEIVTNQDGYSLVKAEPVDGAVMGVFPMNCKGDSKTGQCGFVGIESGQWNIQLSADQLNKWNSEATLSDALMYEGSKGPVTEYMFQVEKGISPDQVASTFALFATEMTMFRDYASSTQKSSSTGGFAVEGAKKLSNSELRSGATMVPIQPCKRNPILCPG